MLRILSIFHPFRFGSIYASHLKNPLVRLLSIENNQTLSSANASVKRVLKNMPTVESLSQVTGLLGGLVDPGCQLFCSMKGTSA